MIIREALPKDLDALHRLAVKLNTVNLQPDIEMLNQQIEWSTQSFRHKVPVEKAEYLFVAEHNDHIVGASLIIAQHGTFERPAVYFKVRYDQKYSTSLKAHFKHQVLDLTFDYDGPTEIGGLIVDKDYRGRASTGFGKPLSFARFLYIAMYREFFRNEIVAELLPPLRDDGKSDLWEAFGERFCGIDYTEADRRSRLDIEFIRSLFPHFPIYTTLLPQEIQDQIGTVGAASKPAESLLTRLGFAWDHSIDPFDGGPTFRVQTDRCLAVRRTIAIDFVGSIDPDHRTGGQLHDKPLLALVAKLHPSDQPPPPFVAALGGYERTFHGVKLDESVTRNLDLHDGDRIAFMPFSGLNLVSF